MKTRLDKEQSQHLIDLGVSREKASGVDTDNFDNIVLLAAEAIADGSGDKTIRSLASPIFKLDDFLNGDILPKEIRKEGPYFTIYRNIVGYAFNFDHEGLTWYMSFEKEELIDSLYCLTDWYYDKFLKAEKK